MYASLESEKSDFKFGSEKRRILRHFSTYFAVIFIGALRPKYVLSDIAHCSYILKMTDRQMRFF